MMFRRPSWSRPLEHLEPGGALVLHRYCPGPVYRFEQELLFRAAGFSRWEILGGFDGRPLKAADDQMIAWALIA